MSDPKKRGILYLVPTPLAALAMDAIPTQVKKIVADCKDFIVESNKIGRRHIMSMAPGKDLRECYIDVYNKNTDLLELPNLLGAIEEGRNICLLSDAGSPSIADPGNALVRLAHLREIKVQPLVGPSSILLALAGSGLNGQQFVFHGYLSPQKKQLVKELKKLDRMTDTGQTQIFMETPYRNEQILTALQNLRPNTLLCIAAQLTGKDEFIQTKEIQTWQKSGLPDLSKKPCIFLLGR